MTHSAYIAAAPENTQALLQLLPFYQSVHKRILKILTGSIFLILTTKLSNQMCVSPSAGKLIEIAQPNTLHNSLRPGWEDMVRRCLQMFLHRSEGQPWSYKVHYTDGNTPHSVTVKY